jgi:hypothetical protein
MRPRLWAQLDGLDDLGDRDSGLPVDRRDVGSGFRVEEADGSPGGGQKEPAEVSDLAAGRGGALSGVRRSVLGRRVLVSGYSW